MKLMCSGCQQWIQVGDELAGKRAQCPLCKHVFDVPALPKEPGLALDEPSVPSSPPTSAGGSTPMFNDNKDAATPSSANGGEVYQVIDEPVKPAAPPPTVPTPSTAPSSFTAPSPVMPTPAPKPAGVKPTGSYQTVLSFSLSPEVLQWVPAACVVVIFVMQFFTWVAVAPGGVDVVSQNAWQAAFGKLTIDNDLRFVAEPLKAGAEEADVGASLLSIFYLLLFIPALAVVVAVAVVPYVTTPLPPQVKQLLPWRWAICAGAVAVPMLFLGLQLIAGYELEDKWLSSTQAQIEKDLSGGRDTLNTVDQKKFDMQYGMAAAALDRSWALSAVVTLHVVALLAAAMMFWYGQRGEGQPLPRLEMKW